jgi:hypothetical protein
MQRILLKAFLSAIPLMAGCAALEEWTAGSITQGIPKMRAKIPSGAKVYFADPVNINGYLLHERGRKQVQDAFVRAFSSSGARYSLAPDGCSHAIYVVVERWEYGDGGFLGSGDRDCVDMEVLVRDIKTSRVLTRASLRAKRLDHLVGKYVKSLFENGE